MCWGAPLWACWNVGGGRTLGEADCIDGELPFKFGLPVNNECAFSCLLPPVTGDVVLLALRWPMTALGSVDASASMDPNDFTASLR
jgi:hypothetical protein